MVELRASPRSAPAAARGGRPRGRRGETRPRWPRSWPQRAARRAETGHRVPVLADCDERLRVDPRPRRLRRVEASRPAAAAAAGARGRAPATTVSPRPAILPPQVRARRPEAADRSAPPSEATSGTGTRSLRRKRPTSPSTLPFAIAVNCACCCRLSSELSPVTHPFHPWLGREFVLVAVRQMWGWIACSSSMTMGRRSRCRRAGRTSVSRIPFVALAAGRSPLRVEDLLVLAELIEVQRRGGR